MNPIIIYTSIDSKKNAKTLAKIIINNHHNPITILVLAQASCMSCKHNSLWASKLFLAKILAWAHGAHNPNAILVS